MPRKAGRTGDCLAKGSRLIAEKRGRPRVTEDEALTAVRASGGRDVSEVDFLILESDGSLTASLRK
jgi:uncharacterized membrane protein YcaP (DUF421 family)